ncbi:type III restriction endonuclease, partial [bacterium]|nr:type III restriction endonuclease [bacterium]
NCRSLFGVALFREPKSKIFVLQATMRCLRSIGVGQQTGQVYLSNENIKILEDELQQNFRVNLDDFRNLGTNKKPYEARIVPPPVKIKLARVRKQFTMKKKPLQPEVDIKLDLKSFRVAYQEIITDSGDRIEFSEMTLIVEISRYLNIPCLQIEEILSRTTKGISHILEHVNLYNDLLYDHVIPNLFKELYEITEKQQTEEYEVELVKEPLEGFYKLTAADHLVAHRSEAVTAGLAEKSFHLDPYCFDSIPEKNLFWDLLRDGRVTKVYFTGMLTHGQSDFFVQYIDPDSHTIRSYYPDFLM